MSTHKIKWLRYGHQNGMDWESEHTITFRFRTGRPAVMHLRNGDPGYPADPDEIELVSIEPGAGDHGAFSDIAQAGLESEAQDWLEGDGFDAALEIATSDIEAAREFQHDLRRDR